MFEILNAEMNSTMHVRSMRKIYSESDKDKIKDLYGKLGNTYLKKVMGEVLLNPGSYSIEEDYQLDEEIEEIRDEINRVKREM